MNATEVKAIVDTITALDFMKNDGWIEKYNAEVARIEDSGWKIGIVAHRSLRVKSRSGFTLKRPVYEWLYTVYFYRGNERVWFYQSHADSKREAIMRQEKHPLPKYA